MNDDHSEITEELDQRGRAYGVIADAIDYLVEHYREQPELTELARRVAMSPSHFQRLFKQWAGISPKRFLQYLTWRRARALIDQDRTTLSAALASGLSGGSRLHDLFLNCEAVTPGSRRHRGRGTTLYYGLHEAPFGPMFVAESAVGLTQLSFVEEQVDPVAVLAKEWPEARLIEDIVRTRSTLIAALEAWIATRRIAQTRLPRLNLHGSNFQLQVWQALLTLPFGAAISYGELAAALGKPGAARAVGQAVGANPIALYVPCHRVIHASGALTGYRWGEAKKRLLLGYEHGTAADL